MVRKAIILSLLLLLALTQNLVHYYLFRWEVIQQLISQTPMKMIKYRMWEKLLNSLEQSLPRQTLEYILASSSELQLKWWLGLTTNFNFNRKKDKLKSWFLVSPGLPPLRWRLLWNTKSIYLWNDFYSYISKLSAYETPP